MWIKNSLQCLEINAPWYYFYSSLGGIFETGGAFPGGWKRKDDDVWNWKWTGLPKRGKFDMRRIFIWIAGNVWNILNERELDIANESNVCNSNLSIGIQWIYLVQSCTVDQISITCARFWQAIKRLLVPEQFESHENGETYTLLFRRLFLRLCIPEQKEVVPLVTH